LSVETGHLFQVRELAKAGVSGPTGKLRLLFNWDDKPSLRLSGKLPTNDQGSRPNHFEADLDLPPVLDGSTYDSFWRALAAQATSITQEELDRWHDLAGKPVLPVAFHTTQEAERQAFVCDLEIPASDWQELGSFDPTVLKNVPLVPASEADAQDWLAWLQAESLTDYVTPGMLEIKGGELLSNFPHHHPRALDPNEMLDKAVTERSDRSWFLLGPSDLGLWSKQ
jgi:hypothetical protein